MKRSFERLQDQDNTTTIETEIEQPKPKPIFNGERLAQARELMGLTTAKLADQIGRLEQEVVLWESKALEPPDEVVAAIVRLLGFPVGFYYRADPPQFGGGRGGPGNSFEWHFGSGSGSGRQS